MKNLRKNCKAKFYSWLAVKKYQIFQMKTIKYYHNVYIKCDVLLLANVFEKFRKSSSEKYGSCLVHYLSAPALTCDGMRNMMEVTTKHISDVDLYLFLSRSIGGGVYYISKRYNKINNNFLKSYDQILESKHNIYLEATNLHGYAKSKCLLTSGFKWVPPNFDSNKYNNRSDLEVDLEYPRELHELHDHYSFNLDKI